MKLVDANLLLFAHNAAAPQFKLASAWLEDAFWDDEPVATSWTNVLAFLRLSTSKIFPRPLSPREGTAIVTSWFNDAGLELVAPTVRHWGLVRALIDDSGARGNLIADAHLAALAIEYGAVLCTDDADFRRFTGVNVLMPLRKR